MMLLTMAGGGGEGFNWQGLVVQLLGFLLLALVLWKFVVPVLRKMAQGRSQAIEDRFAKLEGEIEATRRLMEEHRARLSGMEAEARGRMAAAEKEGAATRAALIAEGEALARMEYEKARREIQMERDKAVLEIKAAVVEMTLEATERLVHSSVSERVHNAMVDRYLDGLEEAVGRP